MPGEKKPEAAFVMAMDMHGFSKLSPSDHDKVVLSLYPEIAGIVHVDDTDKLLDRKTMGDGFMFYFAAADDAVDAALQLRELFRENYFWNKHNFATRLTVRIGLHAGQFFKMYDAIETRDALFGRNIIAVARLEPVVRQNEVWCTASFKAEATINKIDDRVKFASLGNCELAKEWSTEPVFALYKAGETQPSLIPQRQEQRAITVNNKQREYPFTYFALLRLKHRSDGIEYLKRRLALKEGFKIEAIYDLFGAFDILVRFKAEQEQTNGNFGELLVKGKIIWPDDRFELTQIHFEDEKREPIVILPPNSKNHIKAFTYVKSSVIIGDRGKVREVVEIARGACGADNGVVTYYTNCDTLILPIVIRTSDYYALAKAVEEIEELVDRRHWEHVTITTYAVHGLEELYSEGEK